MPEGLSPNPSPEEIKSSEQEPSLFDASGGLEGVFQQILSMKEQGQALAGSQREYSPGELAQSVMRALDAVNQVANNYDTWLSHNGSRVLAGELSAADAPTNTIDNLPELQQITRSGGLREAVTDVLRQEMAKPRTINPSSSALDISGSIIELCRLCLDAPQSG